MKSQLKSMKLYAETDRIHRELEAVGIGRDGALRVADLTPFDQYHYHGTKAVDEAIAALGLNAKSRVLDIGAGLGGPARYIAEHTGAHVTALELQEDLSAVGAGLTSRCGLSDRVTHRAGNVLDGVAEQYDAIISLLCFLHIADRARLFSVCRKAIVQGGAIYIEDYALRRALTESESQALTVKVQCPYLPMMQQYRQDLEAFGNVEIEDVTEDWTTFTASRLAAYRANRARNLALHGEALVDGLEDFYATVAALFANGAIAGVKIRAN